MGIMVIDAAKKSCCRILLGSGWTGLGEGVLPENIFLTKAPPHGSVFQKVLAKNRNKNEVGVIK